LHLQSVLTVEMGWRLLNTYSLSTVQIGQQNANSTLMTPLASHMCSWIVRTWWNFSLLRGICPPPRRRISSAWRARHNNKVRSVHRSVGELFMSVQTVCHKTSPQKLLYRSLYCGSDHSCKYFDCKKKQ